MPRAADAGFSITVRLNSWLCTAIDDIDEAAWTDIPAEQWAPNDGVAQVAQVAGTFGLGCIAWFAWVGIELLRGKSGA